MKQLLISLFKRDDEELHEFLKETKINTKLWSEMLKDKKAKTR